MDVKLVVHYVTGRLYKVNGRLIPQDETIKYLGIHLDRRPTWKTHIFTDKQLGLIYARKPTNAPIIHSIY
jgi:hypothetical protein